jgi:O-antigen/teichoic acid export membrane protein
MLKNTFYMALTTGAKLVSGIVVFILMARILGPVDFGKVAYAFTLSSLYVLIVDYGFIQQLLREVGANPSSIKIIMGRVFIAKIFLSFITIIICFLYLFLYPKDPVTTTIFWLLLFSSILGSFSEFFNAAFRCIGQYGRETNIASIGAIIHFILIVSILATNPNIELLGYVFVLSKTLYLIVSWFSYKKWVGGIKLESNLIHFLHTLKSGFAYATDAGFTNLFYQIDTIIVTHFLGFSSLGNYQAATKWLQGTVQFAPVLANVYIPKLASLDQDKRSLVGLSNSFNTKMLLVGFLSGLFFFVFGSMLSHQIYGSEYNEVNKLWPAIGVLIFTRYLSGAQGTLLMAYGFQKVRVFTQFSALIILIITAPILIKKLGLIGMLVALQINVFFVFCIYMAMLAKYKRPNGFNKFKLMLISTSLILGAYFQFYLR